MTIEANNGLITSTVTIVTAARNAALFLGACARSVFAQSSTQWRWVIVNDGSTDGTREMAYSYAFEDNRVRAVNQGQTGVSAARNAAFFQVDHPDGNPTSESTSEYVLFLDADDELTPNALEKLVALAKRYPGAPAVCGAFTLIDERGASLDWSPTETQLKINQSGLLTGQILQRDNPLWNPAQVLIRRSALEMVREEGKVFDEDFSLCEDWDLWIRLSALGPLICEQFVTVQYRKHPNGAVTKRRSELPPSIAQLQGKHKNRARNVVSKYAIDPLQRVQIPRNTIPKLAKNRARNVVTNVALLTMASKGFDGLLDSFLGSVHQRGELPDDATVYVLNMSDDARCRTVIASYERGGLDVVSVPCKALARANPSIKAAMYAAAEIIEADYYLCLDVDTLILQSLRPLFEQMQNVAAHKILCARDANGHYHWANMDFGVATIGEYLAAVYDLWLPKFEKHAARLGAPLSQVEYVVNDGVFGGSRAAMLQLSKTLRDWMPRERAFLDAHPIRNQLLFNLALAKNGAFARLNDLYNVQVHAVQENLEARGTAKGTAKCTVERSLVWHHPDGPIYPAILHFTGYTKNEFPELQKQFRLHESRQNALHGVK